jgi:NAD(P)-dependent dehydrogenase (short-subunit alcohol dehydrogenase family)
MFVPDTLKGKTALVTGIGQPFADAVARRYAELGARVVLVHDPRDREAAARFDAPADALRLECDGTDAGAVKALVRQVVAEVGSLDILVCASFDTAPRAPLREIEPAEWQRVIDAQLCSTLHFNREVIRPMMRNKSGRIINVLYGVAGAASAVASRGVSSLTRALATELAPQGIYVNSISVGQLAEQESMNEEVTRQLSVLAREASPLGRAGRADEAAEVAVFLASDAGKLTNGHTLPAAGGVYP